MKSAKGINRVIDLVIYPFDVMLSVGETDKTLFKQLDHAGVDNGEFKQAMYEDIGQARYCLFKSGQSLIRIKGKPDTIDDWATLQHEIFHCASAILWRMGIKLKIKSSGEVYAYLIQYLTKEIYALLAT